MRIGTKAIAGRAKGAAAWSAPDREPVSAAPRAASLAKAVAPATGAAADPARAENSGASGMPAENSGTAPAASPVRISGAVLVSAPVPSAFPDTVPAEGAKRLGMVPLGMSLFTFEANEGKVP
jgi:hypothetical protein